MASRPDALALHRYQLLSFDQTPPAPVLDIDGALNRRPRRPWYAAKTPPGYAIALKDGSSRKSRRGLPYVDWRDVVGVASPTSGNGEILSLGRIFTTAPDYSARVRRAGETLIADVTARAAGRPVFVASDNRDAFDHPAQVRQRVPGAFTFARDIPDSFVLEYLSSQAQSLAWFRSLAADMWRSPAARSEVVCWSLMAKAASLRRRR